MLLDGSFNLSLFHLKGLWRPEGLDSIQDQWCTRILLRKLHLREFSDLSRLSRSSSSTLCTNDDFSEGNRKRKKWTKPLLIKPTTMEFYPKVLQDILRDSKWSSILLLLIKNPFPIKENFMPKIQEILDTAIQSSKHPIPDGKYLIWYSILFNMSFGRLLQQFPGGHEGIGMFALMCAT